MISKAKAGKRIFPAFIHLFFICVVPMPAKAQCPAGTFDNTGFFPAFVTPSQPGIANENTAHAAWGGDYYLFSVTAGNTYIFRSCFPENSAINTVLSLYNTAGTTLLAFNDDFCGLQSQVSWLATFTGQVRLSYYQSGCATAFIDTKLGVYYTTPCTAPSITTNPVAAITCNNYNTSFSTVAGGTAPLSYQWQVNTGAGFSNITNGGVYANATTATLNITGATTGMNSYQYRCVVTNTCGNATSNAATLTVNATNNWTGAVNNNWHTAGNWSCGTVPGPNDDVVISSGSPTIAAGATGQCRNLTKSGLVSGVTFNDATLQVYGNLNYTGGSFNTNTGSSMRFMGASQQQLLGSTPLTISNLVINNAAGVVTNKNIVLTGTLNFIAGHLYTQDYRVTASNVTGASASAFVVTADAGNVPSPVGTLTIPMNPGDVKLFPAGPSSTSYNPAELQLVSGPAETISIRMGNTAPAGATAALSVQRTWHISENTAGGNEINLTLQWNTSHEGGSFNRSYCGLMKSNGTNIVFTGYTMQNGPASSAGVNTYRKTTVGITAFSPWGVTSDIAILPVVLKSFNLFTTPQQKAELEWELAAGSTPRLFSLYRSSNGIDYTLWQDMPVITNDLFYRITDDQPLPGNSYYRLKITGQAGEEKYSSVLRFRNEAYKSFSSMVYPNPATDFVQVDVGLDKAELVQLLLINSAGQNVLQRSYSLQRGSHILSLDISRLPAGIYNLVIRGESGLQQAHSLLKK